MQKRTLAAYAATLLTFGCSTAEAPIAAPAAPSYIAASSKASQRIEYEAKRHGVLFVANTYANSTGEVDIYPQHPGSQIGTITNGLYFPIGLTVDSSQNLYVANGGPHGDQGYVTEYSPPYTGAPIATYTQGLQYNFANAVAVGTDGTLYVSEYSAGVVVEFPPGSTTPSAQLTFHDYPGARASQSPGKPEGLALDANNNLYVAVNFDGVNLAEVIKIKPKARKGRVDVSLAQSSAGIAFDGNGNLAVERQRTYNVHRYLKRWTIPPAVFVFPPGQSTPSRRIDDHFADANALAFNRNRDHLYVSGSIIVLSPHENLGDVARGTAQERSAVYCVAYPSGKLLYTIAYPAGSWLLGVAATAPTTH